MRLFIRNQHSHLHRKHKNELVFHLTILFILETFIMVGQMTLNHIKSRDTLRNKRCLFFRSNFNAMPNFMVFKD